MLAYDDQPAMSLQLHPEFDPDYAKALIEARRGTRYGSRNPTALWRPTRRPTTAAGQPLDRRVF